MTWTPERWAETLGTHFTLSSRHCPCVTSFPSHLAKAGFELVNWKGESPLPAFCLQSHPVCHDSFMSGHLFPALHFDQTLKCKVQCLFPTLSVSLKNHQVFSWIILTQPKSVFFFFFFSVPNSKPQDFFSSYVISNPNCYWKSQGLLSLLKVMGRLVLLAYQQVHQPLLLTDLVSMRHVMVKHPPLK